MIKKILAAKLLAITLVIPANTDEWTFFHPELVTKLSYRVILADVSGMQGAAEEKYLCEVHADRSDPEVGNFDFTAGYFPPTVKGRHQAEKVCSKWMDKAHKLIVKARGDGR